MENIITFTKNQLSYLNLLLNLFIYINTSTLLFINCFLLTYVLNILYVYRNILLFPPLLSHFIKSIIIIILN